MRPTTRIGVIQSLINEILVIFAFKCLAADTSYPVILWIKCHMIRGLQIFASQCLTNHTLNQMDYNHRTTKMAVSAFTLTYHNKSISVLF